MSPFVISVLLVRGDPRPVAWFVLPGETLSVRHDSVPAKGIRASGGKLKPIGDSVAVWKAPKRPGPYWIWAGRDSILVLVKVPYKKLKKGKIGRYPIGRYPKPKGSAHPEAYHPPDGFIKVTRQTKDLPISPRFTLGQFTCPWPKRWPRYLALKRELVLFLEELADSLGVSGFRVLSGFRSPIYNRRRRRSRLSRHQFGDAADIIVDEDRDWRMDDINHDGKSDVRDAWVIYETAEKIARSWGVELGMGMYPNPFIHIDLRGFTARWNPKTLIAWVEPETLLRPQPLASRRLVKGGFAPDTPSPDPPYISLKIKKIVIRFPFRGKGGRRRWAVESKKGRKNLWRYTRLLWDKHVPEDAREGVADWCLSPDSQTLYLVHRGTLYAFNVKKGYLWLSGPRGADQGGQCACGEGWVVLCAGWWVVAYSADATPLWAQRAEALASHKDSLLVLSGDKVLLLLAEGKILAEMDIGSLGYRDHSATGVGWDPTGPFVRFEPLRGDLTPFRLYLRVQ